ncbi:RNA-directed DNA polymerase, eukaryota, partial [Tanacetum coccineum]
SQSSLELSFRRIPRGGTEEDQLLKLTSQIKGVMLSNSSDRWTWSLEGSGEFSVASVRKLIDDKLLPVLAVKTRWIKVVPLKINIHAWKVNLDCLPTRINISRRGMDIESILCPMCDNAAESASHLFFTCRVAKEVFHKILCWWDVDYMDIHSYEEWVTWIMNLRVSLKHKKILEGVCYVMWWHIWAFRNKNIFSSKNAPLATIFDDVVAQSFFWCRFKSKVSFSLID